jgi:hypothetical protein
MILPSLTALSTATHSTLLRGARRGISQKVLTEETMLKLSDACGVVRSEAKLYRPPVVCSTRLLRIRSSHPQIDHVLYTNVGNPHSVGQESLRWPRLVMALCNLPDELGIDHPEAIESFQKKLLSERRN